MKRITLITLATLVLPLTALAADKKEYVVIAPHTADQCLTALDAMVADKKLDKWDFGCMDGDHTGYLVVKAASKEDALSNVPANQRSQAKAIELNKFTVAQVKSFHDKK